MSDRELLELAAKAAGIDGVMTQPFTGLHVTGYGDWNPLENDGDALRLAVRLRQDLDLQASTPGVVFVGTTPEYAEDDPNAATRRAIVRAAAEIGRAVP